VADRSPISLKGCASTAAVFSCSTTKDISLPMTKNHAFMYINFFVFLALVFHLVTLQAQDTEVFQKKIFIHQGDTLPYRILLPADYDSTRQYPLVLFLHGAGERGKDNARQLTHGSSLFINHRTNYPAIVIFPQCPEGSYWSAVTIDRNRQPFDFRFHYDQPPTKPFQAAIALTQSFIREKKADKNRIYIMGLSMGGMGTFEAIHRYPKMFAAALPICGAGDDENYHRKARRVPFWVFHGAEDSVVGVQESRQMVEKLKKIGAKVLYSEYPGVDHASWDNAFQEDALLPWMFDQHR